MRRTAYNKQEVILDIQRQKLSTDEIAVKYGITVGNVYTIKSSAIRSGIIKSTGHKNIEERMRDELTVFNPELRERIKDLRDQDYTTSEITNLLIQKGVMVAREDVEKVMARGANMTEERIAKHRLGRVVRG